jgi:hypothetical protein
MPPFLQEVEAHRGERILDIDLRHHQDLWSLRKRTSRAALTRTLPSDLYQEIDIDYTEVIAVSLKMTIAPNGILPLTVGGKDLDLEVAKRKRLLH